MDDYVLYNNDRTYYYSFEIWELFTLLDHEECKKLTKDDYIWLDYSPESDESPFCVTGFARAIVRSVSLKNKVYEIRYDCPRLYRKGVVELISKREPSKNLYTVDLVGLTHLTNDLPLARFIGF